jgi:plasmid stability protein
MGEIELPDDVLAALRAYAAEHGLTESQVVARWLRDSGVLGAPPAD